MTAKITMLLRKLRRILCDGSVTPPYVVWRVEPVVGVARASIEPLGVLVPRAVHLQHVVEECAMHWLSSTLTEGAGVGSGAFVRRVGSRGGALRPT